MIEFKQINKTYRVAKRQAGMGNAVRAFFRREYETVHALNDVNFSIQDGEMVGYIGPNGAGKSTTIVLTTHDMQDIEALTERILLIGRGKILLDGSLSELRKHTSDNKTMVIQYRGTAPALREGMEQIQSGEGQMTVRFSPARIPASEAIAYFAAHTELLDVSVADISTDEMVAALYKEYRL